MTHKQSTYATPFHFSALILAVFGINSPAFAICEITIDGEVETTPQMCGEDPGVTYMALQQNGQLFLECSDEGTVSHSWQISLIQYKATSAGAWSNYFPSMTLVTQQDLENAGWSLSGSGDSRELIVPEDAAAGFWRVSALCEKTWDDLGCCVNCTGCIGEKANSASVEFTLFDVRIAAPNDVLLAPPPATHHGIIGGHYQFKGVVLPDLTVSAHAWDVGGTPDHVVKSYTVSDSDSHYSVLTSGDLDNSTVEFHWKKPYDSTTVTYTATVNGINKSATVNVKVWKPTSSLTATFTNENPEVDIRDGNRLQFGDWELGQSPGISWHGEVMTQASGAGKIALFQVVSTERRFVEDDNDELSKSSGGLFLADAPVPYHGIEVAIGGSDTKAIAASDSPGVLDIHTLGIKEVNIVDSYKLYLMYQPTGGIWVTLRVLEWQWSANANKGANGWDAGDVDQYSVDYSKGPSVDSFVLPEWSQTISEVPWE